MKEGFPLVKLIVTQVLQKRVKEKLVQEKSRYECKKHPVNQIH